MRFFRFASMCASLLAIPAFILLALAVMTNPANAQVQIAVISDSNVYGKGVVTSENYPSQLESALNARGLNVRTSNGGINGDVSAGLLARLDSAVPQGTKVTVIWIGINDYRRGIGLPEIRTNVNEIVRRLRSRGIDSYVIRPPVYDLSLHRNPATSLPDLHMNAAGYARMVARTIGPVQALVRKAKTG